MAERIDPGPSEGQLKIGFTGHRDRRVDARWLDWVRDSWPGAVWVHGGAAGFDSQVERYARAHGIPTETIRPDYGKHTRGATFIRNREIVQSVQFLVACYDGREEGGTAYTVNYARRSGAPVILLPVQGEGQTTGQGQLSFLQ